MSILRHAGIYEDRNISCLEVLRPLGFAKAQSAGDWLVERCKLGHGCDTDGDTYTLADWFTISVHALAYATASSS